MRATSKFVLGLMSTVALWGPARNVQAVEVMPVVGISQPVDEEQDRYEWGGHGGISIGGRLTDLISIHGQLDLHYLNVDGSEDTSGWGVLIGAAPLFHVVSNDSLTLVLGPSLGFYRGSIASERSRDVELKGSGFYLGGLMGLFIRARGGFALGPVLSYTRLFPSEACATVGALEVCDRDPDDFGMLALGLGFWF